jgi:hypothetical protein
MALLDEILAKLNELPAGLAQVGPTWGQRLRFPPPPSAQWRRFQAGSYPPGSGKRKRPFLRAAAQLRCVGLYNRGPVTPWLLPNNCCWRRFSRHTALGRSTDAAIHGAFVHRLHKLCTPTVEVSATQIMAVLLSAVRRRSSDAPRQVRISLGGPIPQSNSDMSGCNLSLAVSRSGLRRMQRGNSGAPYEIAHGLEAARCHCT